jgi:hypothetical protein
MLAHTGGGLRGAAAPLTHPEHGEGSVAHTRGQRGAARSVQACRLSTVASLMPRRSACARSCLDGPHCNPHGLRLGRPALPLRPGDTRVPPAAPQSITNVIPLKCDKYLFSSHPGLPSHPSVNRARPVAATCPPRKTNAKVCAARGREPRKGHRSGSDRSLRLPLRRAAGGTDTPNHVRTTQPHRLRVANPPQSARQTLASLPTLPGRPTTDGHEAAATAKPGPNHGTRTSDLRVSPLIWRWPGAFKGLGGQPLQEAARACQGGTAVPPARRRPRRSRWQASQPSALWTPRERHRAWEPTCTLHSAPSASPSVFARAHRAPVCLCFAMRACHACLPEVCVCVCANSH